MKKYPFIFLCILLLFSVSADFSSPIRGGQGGTQYYLNTASTGSGDGTTQATSGANAAWAAISEITGLSAGDTVSFNKGNTWREQLAPPTTGTNGNVITFNSYGSGVAPIINGGTLATTWTLTSGTDLSGDANLLALWYMEDATGATRLDETANNVDLTDSNSVVRHATHVQGTYAAAFTATSSMQLNAADGILPATWPHSNGASDTNYTMGGWFRVNNVSADHSLMSKGWRANLYIDSTESYKPRFKILNADPAALYVLANAAIVVDTWTHIVVRVDVGDADEATMWIDGVKQNDVLTIADLSEDADPFEIGDSQDKPYLDGYADECFMFDRALTDAEILGIKNDFVDGSDGGVANIYEKTFANIPTVVLEDGALLTFVDWDTDLATTGAAMSAGTYSVDDTNKIAYVWCTDNADPDTHTMEVSAETGDARIVIKCRNVSYVTFDGLDVRQATKANINIDSTATNDVSNIIVQNCTSKWAGVSGIVIQNWANLSAGYPITACTIDSNTVHHNGQHGIQATYHVTSTTISDNTVYNNGWKGVSVATGGHGITAWSNDADSYVDSLTIESNTVYGNYGESSGNAEGTGIQLDDLTRNSIVRYNLVYDNEGSGLIDNTTQNSQWYYNLVYGNGTASNQGGFYILNTTVGCVVYNNVFYDNRYGVSITNSAANVTVKNNILSENTTQEIVAASGATTGHAIDYNCVYHSGGGTFMDWAGTDYNWADWLTNSSQDANSINTDPLMTDPANDLFTLHDHSPCIFKGVAVGLLVDYAGVLIRHGPCIGTYENQINAIWDE